MQLRALVVGLGFLFISTGTAQAQQATVDEFNRDLQAVWDNMRPMLLRMVHTQAQSQIGNLRTQSGVATISIKNLRHIGLHINTAPGLTQSVAASRIRSVEVSPSISAPGVCKGTLPSRSGRASWSGNISP